MIERFYSRPETIARLRSGPLGSHIDGFTETLSKQGYSFDVITKKIRAVGKIGRWLSQGQVDLVALDEQRIIEFIEYCRGKEFLSETQSAALNQLLCYLRKAGVVPTVTPISTDMRQPIEKEFEEYLALERGVSPLGRRYQLLIARRFLIERFGTSTFDCSQLCAADVTQFTLRHAYTYKLRTAQTMLSALRGFLRFLYMRGETPNDLTGCVFRVANWHLAGLPKYLEPKQVEHLLQSVDQTTRSGLRDYAILLLLARLGLRGAEVVNLELGDIDWEAGTITVRGKGKWYNRLPIPQDVGEAIVKYLRYGRPKCSCRRVFIRTVAPYRELLSSAATHDIVENYLARAGLHPDRKGTHLLRHSLATRMIRGGNTLDEIGDILGHQFHSSTEIYAKVAITSLRALAQPWPGGRP
ncbi:MAG: site-specific integrase [Thermodesulfobacteriota bacterium]|jgi:site-specific recombinase XerD